MRAAPSIMQLGIWLVAAWLVGLSSPLASADETDGQAEDQDVVVPGPDEDPPGPPQPKDEPVLRPNASQRRAIRGAPEVTPQESPQKRLLREFEDETFGQGHLPRPGHEADDESPLGENVAPFYSSRPTAKDDLPDELRSPHRPGRFLARPATPELLRPDLPWLKGLKVGDLPIRWDPRVIRYLEFYRDDPRGRSIMTAWLRDQGRYRKQILNTLARHGLPRDLLNVSMIESSYNPLEYSRAGASGLWQFMPSAAKAYGLRVDFWVDERNDHVKSTEAAMLYMRDLYERFGDWHLVLAAYNTGYGAVLKSIAKYNTNDFWALLDLEGGLPWESSIYVPKALAASIVGHNLEAFGYSAVVKEPSLEHEMITVPTSVPLSLIARAAGVDPKALLWLNPHLRRGRTPAGESDFPVRIPKGTRDAVAKTFPGLRGDWDGFDAYVVRHGERFEDIARTHGISVARLRELNGVSDITEVRGGTTIVVPRLDEETRKANRALAQADLYRSEVTPGGPEDPMLVAVPDKDFTIPGKRRVFYRVVAGDTLEEVATAIGLSAMQLAGWNGISPDAKLQARMVLVAYVDEGFDPEKNHVALLEEKRLLVVTAGSPEHLDIVESRKGRARVKVVAKAGDTLESIGRRYGLSKHDVARINRRSYVTPLKPGEELIVYSIVDRARAKQAGVLKAKPGKAKKPGKRAVAIKGRSRSSQAPSKKRK
ncbi:MAG: transglycosylase SLT domain-containing protein [Deltaproteobacteria bacterium]|nr:transglycosylase SLT domain-containing protein [Deltaproteobacteria bacterium]